MNHSGDAAEQIVRLSLEGVEVAARITGNAAKEIALFLFAALKNKDKNLKLKGRARLTAMLKSGKALEIYSVKESDLRKFAEGAKEYGIVYCVLRNTKNAPDGLCDIMVKAEDAPKITRLAERFQFATVDKAKIESEIVASKAERAAAAQAQDAEPNAPEIDDIDRLLDDLLGTDEGQRDAAPDAAHGAGLEKEGTDQSPLADGVPPKTGQSEPTSGNKDSSAKPISSRKASVKEDLREITAAKKAKEVDTPVREDRAVGEKPQDKPTTTTHKQPQGGKKSKNKKSKGRH
jgi:hypothetical protein